MWSLLSRMEVLNALPPPKKQHTRTRAQGIVGRAEGWEGRIGDLETALMLLGASPEEGESGGDQEACVGVWLIIRFGQGRRDHDFFLSRRPELGS